MTAPDPTVLLVEDDLLVRGFLADNLIADGFAVVAADTLREGAAPARARATRRRDRGRRAAGRLGAGARARACAPRATPASRVDPALPVLVLSGRGAEMDRIRGFDRGADDYVVKPFSYPELRRRVEALLRRSRERVPGGRAAGRRAGDRPGEPRRARRGQHAALSQKEFALLLALAAQPTAGLHEGGVAPGASGATGRWAARGRWTRTPAGCATSSAAAGGRYVVNVWGVGYRLVDGRGAAA